MEVVVLASKLCLHESGTQTGFVVCARLDMDEQIFHPWLFLPVNVTHIAFECCEKPDTTKYARLSLPGQVDLIGFVCCHSCTSFVGIISWCNVLFEEWYVLCFVSIFFDNFIVVVASRPKHYKREHCPHALFGLFHLSVPELSRLSLARREAFIFFER